MATIAGIDFTTPAELAVTTDLTVGGNTALSGKVALGNAVADSIGLYGVSKVSQRRSASQAAVTKLTTTTLTSPGAVAAKLNALITYSMRVRADLIALGAIKGSS